jgi:hypothetical protein
VLVNQVLLLAGVVLLPLPSFVLGCRGVRGHRGYSRAEPGDRASLVVLVILRSLALLLLLALSAITVVSCVGALIKGVPLHGLVYVFFGLDLLLSLLVLLSFGRRERRRARRRVTPAMR